LSNALRVAMSRRPQVFRQQIHHRLARFERKIISDRNSAGGPEE